MCTQATAPRFSYRTRSPCSLIAPSKSVQGRFGLGHHARPVDEEVAPRQEQDVDQYLHGLALMAGCVPADCDTMFIQPMAPFATNYQTIFCDKVQGNKSAGSRVFDRQLTLGSMAIHRVQVAGEVQAVLEMGADKGLDMVWVLR